MASSGAAHLISRAGPKQLALHLADVVEVMRPLPVFRLEGLPAFVLGAAVVRGAAVPVLDARTLLGERPASPGEGRFISLRVGARNAVLAVDALVGVRTLEEAVLQAMPGVLAGAADGVAELVGALDQHLLLVLSAGRLVPASAWSAVLDADHA